MTLANTTRLSTNRLPVNDIRFDSSGNAITQTSRGYVPVGQQNQTPSGGDQIRRQQSMIKNVRNVLQKKKALATQLAEGEAKDEAYAENKQTADKTYNFALAQANKKRAVGGGLVSGGDSSINSFTGGLVKANQEARMKDKVGLATTAFEADETTMQMRNNLSSMVNRLNQLRRARRLGTQAPATNTSVNRVTLQTA